MPSAMTTFEYLLAALETTRGTAVATPTHYLNMQGTITPKNNKYRPAESRGILAEYTRSKIIRQWAEWQGSGPADVYTIGLLLAMNVKGGVTPTTPGGGTNSRLWTYAPTMTSDDLKAATLYWGDPNVQPFQSDFGMCDSITVSGDAAATNGVTMSAKGLGGFPAKVAPLSVPSMLNAPLLAPGDMQVWFDTASAIGTTEVTTRILSAEFTIPSGNTYRYLAAGPTGGTQYSGAGRKPRHAESKVVFDLPDMNQYDVWAAGTVGKLRIRFNGPVIETTLRHYIEFDIYGPFEALDWGDSEGARTIALTTLSEYNATAGYDWAIKIQNDRATL